MTSQGTSLRVTLEQSAEFARLSGDSNPLHVDPILARRTQFGTTVVHGIHLLLGALDRLAASGQADDLELAALTATFNNPVRTGAQVILQVRRDERGRVRIAAESESRPAFVATLELQPCDTRKPAGLIDAPFAVATPDDVALSPSLPSGSVELRLDEKLLAALFPALAQRPARAWIADLLATTNVVGMRCPGLHSIYSSFKLQRRPAAEAAAAHKLQYDVERTDLRFRMVRMRVSGAALEGTIDAFFRPAPVHQLSLRELCTLVAANEFAGQRALVIGGSRGLGELAAKIVAAGGGAVTITYARGEADARRICTEASAAGKSCIARHLDMEGIADGNIPPWLAADAFTHVYYFASPPIAKNPTALWNHALFEQFARIYVHGFALVAGHMLGAAEAEGKPRFFYPSTIYAEQAEPGFGEYAAAKAAGESVCDQLSRRHATQFLKPRLPRMRTDQTSAVQDSGMQESFPVLHPLLRALR
jgi:acyl dehydratase